MLWGICVNAEHGAWPDMQECHLLGAQAVRTIVYDIDAFDGVLTNTPVGVPVIALLNQETAGVGDDLSGWEATVFAFMQRFAGRVLAVECLNEWDSAAQGIAPEQAAHCAATALQLGRGIRGAPRVLLGAVAGDNWVQSLHDATLAIPHELLPRLAGVGLHPYGQRAGGYPDSWGFGELQDALATAYSVTHKPVWCTEYGINLADVDGDESAQTRYLIRARRIMRGFPPTQVMAAMQFCWIDSVGAPGEQFGLRDGDGEPRLAWSAALEAGGNA
jgi:hypothetical protein